MIMLRGATAGRVPSFVPAAGGPELTSGGHSGRRMAGPAMGRLRIACSAGVLALAIGGACDVATAASDICTRLEARLMAIDSRPNDGGIDNYRNFDSAVRKQREELDQATEDARRAGCLGGFFRRLKSGPNCGAIMASIDRMRANLNRLTAQRGRY